MTETQSFEKVSLLEQLVTERDLIVYNDDFNTFDFVIESLIEVCDHSRTQAEQCTLIIHHKGKCQVKRGQFKDIQVMCTALLERGITAEVE